MNFIKLIVLGVVSFASLQTASHVINDMVIEVSSRQQTIMDVVIKEQVKETFKEVEKEIEKQIEEVAKEEKIEIKVEEVEMKPPLPEETKAPEPVPTPEETVVVEESPVPEEVVDEVLPEETPVVEEAPKDKETIKRELKELAMYFVENYFLDGYTYYQKEEDPILMEKKKAVHEMEVYVIDSLPALFDIILNVKTISIEKVGQIQEKVTGLQEGLITQFSTVEETLLPTYEQTVGYFEEYLSLVGQMKQTLEAVSAATNPLLALPILMNDLGGKIIPGITEVMNKGFVLKDQNNQMYLEGETHDKLLTSEEVAETIVEILGVIKAQASNNTENM